MDLHKKKMTDIKLNDWIGLRTVAIYFVQFFFFSLIKLNVGTCNNLIGLIFKIFYGKEII